MIVSIGGLPAAIPGTVFGSGCVLKFDADAFAAIAGLIVAPGEPRAEDVPVCVVLALPEGRETCEACWEIDIINEGSGPPARMAPVGGEEARLPAR